MKKFLSFFRSPHLATFVMGLILATSVGTISFPQKTDAFIPVIDITNIIQDTLTANATTLTQIQGYVLNPIAWAVAKAALQSVVKGMVNSVNKGPNGSPGFVTNLASTLQAVGDSAANSFISQLASNGSIKSPFQTAVASAVGNNYLQSTGSSGFFSQNAFTLNQVSSNPTAFYSGAMAQNGGLNAWLSAWSNPQNNPFGASMLAANALGAQVGTAQTNQQTELNYGQGFLSSRGKCPTTTTGGSTSGNSLTGLLTSLSANSTCQSSSIQTPGSTIKAALDKSLGSGVDTLVSAHSLDEIVNALLGQLINQVTSSGGLSGVSQPSASTVSSGSTSGATTGTAYFDQTDPTQTGINTNLITNFSQTLSAQITAIQQFQTDWNKINNAALTAKTVLSTTGCYPDAQDTLTNTVQPVIDEAASSLAQASAGITAIQNLQAQLPAANSTTDETDQISTISAEYTNLLDATTTDPTTGDVETVLPDSTQLSDAAEQSTDTSGDASGGTPSLYTQMQQISAHALSCQHN